MRPRLLLVLCGCLLALAAPSAESGRDTRLFGRGSTLAPTFACPSVMNPSQPLIDVDPDHWTIVRDILKKHIPQYEVWAFGSRATGKAKTFSDLDLAIITKHPIPLQVSADLKNAFSEIGRAHV